MTDKNAALGASEQSPAKPKDPPTGSPFLDDAEKRSSLIDRALRALDARARERKAKGAQS